MRFYHVFVRLGLIIGLAIAFSGSSIAASPDETTILKTLNQEHPRLIVISKDIPRIQSLIKEDPTAQKIYQSIKQDADRILTQPTVEYIIVGPRLLTQSRRCLDRIYALSLMYLLDKEPKYLQRAVKELQAAAQFPDWNPSHFLDTAEMTHAFAIGYDWLYADLSPQEKNMIRTALIEKGLNAYITGKKNNAWWINAQHNWNQVCHGGIGIGALAIADEHPDIAAQILSLAIEKMPLALQHYAPDGGWNEGPGYWHYATRYTVYFLASLQTALGTDFGLSDYPGMDNAGQFRIDFQSPTGYSFNYADAGSRVSGTHEMYWLAKRYNRPAYAWMQRQDTRNANALDLIWYIPERSDPSTAQLSLDAFYQGIDVVFMRSAWNDPNAIFVGFKGGDNKANHSHLDLGSFVLDALGQRWAVDLGSDDYNMPGYFGNQRWTYYRLINDSHNTLVLDGANQDPKAAAPILDFQTSSNGASAIADLSQAYQVQKLHRGIALIDRQTVIVRDELESEKPVDFVWGMVTPAQIQIEGKIAILKIQDKFMQVKILTPDSARFDIASAQPPKPQKQNEGMQKLTIRFDKPQKIVNLTVQLIPYENEKEPPQIDQDIESLRQWKK